MFKKILLTFYILNFYNFLLTNENEIRKAEAPETSNEHESKKQKKELDYFVLRFEVDEQDEERFKKLYTVNEWNLQLEDPPETAENYIAFGVRLMHKKKFTFSDFVYPESKNFTSNKDIVVPISNEFNQFEIYLTQSFRDKHFGFGTISEIIVPGKKYIIRFKDLKFFEIDHRINANPENSPKVELEIQDIHEYQLKVRNILNEALEFIPKDINNLISQYIV